MKNIFILIGLLISFQVMAEAPASVPTQPTEASQPIPSLSKTKNVNTVLSEKIQAAIKANPLLDNQAISAASIDGKVILQGSVDTKDQEDEAIKTAKSVGGVVEVKSQLTIKANKTAE